MNDDARDALRALSREVLIGSLWTKLREEFRVAFIRKFQGTIGRGSSSAPKLPGMWSNSIREPQKFRRHCNECLAKWLLAQKARETRSHPQDFFFPQSATAYNKQLIRDLSLKCIDARQQDPAFLQDVESFVSGFQLGMRCQQVRNTVSAEMERVVADGTGGIAAKVETRAMSSDEGQHHRIAGVRREIKVHVDGSSARHALDPIFSQMLEMLNIPELAWVKLRSAFGTFGLSSPTAMTDDEQSAIFEIRATVVVLRYEVNLCSGSLQLCADDSFKRQLAASGFHVIDLCASPINAFMSTPQLSEPDQQQAMVAPSMDQLSPNYFCSAFVDTDRFFGSLGSALQINVAELVEKLDSEENKISLTGKRLLLTLDVPYDEDLCELMLLKLAADIQLVERDVAAASRVQWMLVLPLWWDLHFNSATKRIVGADEAEMKAIIERNNGYLQRGFTIDYTWPGVLCGSPWAAFDAVFISKGYSYYCSSTNKVLNGVTETEIVGLEMPGDTNGPRVSQLLEEFYAAKTSKRLHEGGNNADELLPKSASRRV